MPDLQGELREFFPSYYHIHVGDIWILLQDREDMDDQVDGATSDQTALDMEHRSIPSQEFYKRTKEAEIVDASISEMLSEGGRSGRTAITETFLPDLAQMVSFSLYLTQHLRFHDRSFF